MGPLTGALGTECPLGFVGGNGGKSSAATGVGEGASECPFPFIFLHDPARGWELLRPIMTKNQNAITVFTCAFLAIFAMWIKVGD